MRMNRMRDWADGVLCCIVLAAATSLHAQVYQNPVIRGMNPDPSIVRVGPDYYLVTSSFEYFPGCPVYHSVDLVHWQRIGYALSRASQYPVDKAGAHPSLYAATIRYHEGTFYIITTDVRGGGNFYVTASNPAGPWSDPVYVEKGMFDPSLFFDDDGKVYYTRRGPRPAEGIVQAEIDIKTGHLLTPLRTIATSFLTPGAEGPHLYKIDGWYYLALAEGGSRFLHMETVGRSQSPWGPFEASPTNPLIAQHLSWDLRVLSEGHSDLVQSPDGRWWAVYLATRHDNSGQYSLGRETYLAPVQWAEGWPHVDASALEHLTVKADLPPQHAWPPESAHDDFAQPRLGMSWNLLGPPLHQSYSLTERPGYLRLHGQADGLTPSSATAFVVRRQTERKIVFEAEMEFAPARSNEEAGIVVYMAPNYHYEIFKSVRGGQAVIVLRKSAGNIQQESEPVVVKDGPLRLKIVSDAENYSFYYRTTTSEWKLIGTGTGRLIAAEVANVWTGAYVGMYSTGNGRESTASADFDWADYLATQDEQPDL